MGCRRFGYLLSVPQTDTPREFRAREVRRSVATCADCRQAVPLTFSNHRWDRRYYICSSCRNIIAVEFGRGVVHPQEILRVTWSPGLVARAERIGRWRFGVCKTKRDHLVTRMLFLMASGGRGELYLRQRKRASRVRSSQRPKLDRLRILVRKPRYVRGEGAGARQIFVKKGHRRKGAGTTMVRRWAERFAFPLARTFGVESPNSRTPGILVRLGYVEEHGEMITGKRCYFV